jgi:hypothetical protein
MYIVCHSHETNIVVRRLAFPSEYVYYQTVSAQAQRGARQRSPLTMLSTRHRPLVVTLVLDNFPVEIALVIGALVEPLRHVLYKFPTKFLRRVMSTS